MAQFRLGTFVLLSFLFQTPALSTQQAVFTVSEDSRLRFSTTPDTRGLERSDLEPQPAVLNLTLRMDLSDPEDLDLALGLFHSPVTVNFQVIPISHSGSSASVLLGNCLESVATNIDGTIDQTRVIDFFQSLIRMPSDLGGRMDSDDESPLPYSVRAAKLACQVFTQNLEVVSGFLDPQVTPNSILPIEEISVTVNDETFMKPSLEVVYHIIMRAQYDGIRLTDEL